MFLTLWSGVDDCLALLLGLLVQFKWYWEYHSDSRWGCIRCLIRFGRGHKLLVIICYIFALLSMGKMNSGGRSTSTKCSIESLGFAGIFWSKYFFYRRLFWREFPNALRDIVAGWVKRPTLRAFGVVSVKTSVGSTVGLLIITRPSVCRVSIMEDGKTLVERWSSQL